MGGEGGGFVLLVIGLVMRGVWWLGCIVDGFEIVFDIE